MLLLVRRSTLSVVLIDVWQFVVVRFDLDVELGINRLRVFHFVLLLDVKADGLELGSYLLQLLRFVKLLNGVGHELIHFFKFRLKLIMQLFLPNFSTLPFLFVSLVVLFVIFMEISV